MHREVTNECPLKQSLVKRTKFRDAQTVPRKKENLNFRLFIALKANSLASRKRIGSRGKFGNICLVHVVKQRNIS